MARLQGSHLTQCKRPICRVQTAFWEFGSNTYVGMSMIAGPRARCSRGRVRRAVGTRPVAATTCARGVPVRAGLRESDLWSCTLAETLNTCPVVSTIVDTRAYGPFPLPYGNITRSDLNRCSVPTGETGFSAGQMSRYVTETTEHLCSGYRPPESYVSTWHMAVLIPEHASMF